MSTATKTRPAAKRKTAAASQPVDLTDQALKVIASIDEDLNDARQIGESGAHSNWLIEFAMRELRKIDHGIRAGANLSNMQRLALEIDTLLNGAMAVDDAGTAKVEILRAVLVAVQRLADILEAAARDTDQVDEFACGRGMALEMLRHADRLDGTDDAAAKRWYRGGKAQNRFAQIYLKWLVDNPETLAGFAAVLSAKLTCGDTVDAEAWNLPEAEFEAGEIGADGTEVDTSPQPVEPVEDQTAAHRPAPQAAGTWAMRDEIEVDADAWRELAFDANFQIQKLAHALRRLNELEASDEWPLVSGITSRIEQLSTIVYYAARLYGDDPESIGVPPLKDLRRKFEGGL